MCVCVRVQPNMQLIKEVVGEDAGGNETETIRNESVYFDCLPCRSFIFTSCFTHQRMRSKAKRACYAKERSFQKKTELNLTKRFVKAKHAYLSRPANNNNNNKVLPALSSCRA